MSATRGSMLARTSDRPRSVALVGLLVFVTAAVVVWAWRVDRVEQASGGYRRAGASGAVVIHNAHPPGHIAVEGVPLGAGDDQYVFAQPGTVLHLEAKRAGQISRRDVRVRAGTTEAVSFSFGGPDAGLNVADPIAAPGSTVLKHEAPATGAMGRGALPVSVAKPDRMRSTAGRRTGRSGQRTRRRPHGRTRRNRAVVSAGGKLTVVVYPWANVSIDGKPLGSTPLVGQVLGVGAHVLRLTNRELDKEETSVVTISAAKTLKVRRDWLR